MVAVDCKVTTESASNHEQIPKYSFKCTCQGVCPHGSLQQAATSSSTASAEPGRLACPQGGPPTTMATRLWTVMEEVCGNFGRPPWRRCRSRNGTAPRRASCRRGLGSFKARKVRNRQEEFEHVLNIQMPSHGPTNFRNKVGRFPLCAL